MSKVSKVITIAVVVYVLMQILVPKPEPILALIPSEVDSEGNLLGISADDSSGVGDVFVFKRSYLDMTGLSIRYEREQNSYAWAEECALVNYNRLWVQWISFELPTKEMNIQVKMYEWDENKSIQMNLYVEQKTTIMAKGYLYFALPISKTERVIEIQRFYSVNDTLKVWDETIFYLRHKTLAATIPHLYLPTEVALQNFVALIAGVGSGGFGSFWHGRRVLRKNPYPPKKWEGWLWLSGFGLLLIFSNVSRILSMMVEFPIFFVLTAIIALTVIYIVGYYLTIIVFREKPKRVAVMQPIIDHANEYLALKMVTGYKYEFTDQKGNVKEGWIPESRLDDDEESKRRMRGHHRICDVTLWVRDSEGDDIPKKRWGLTAKDPAHTFSCIHIAKNIEEPFKRVRKRKRLLYVTITTDEGEEKKVVKKNRFGKPIYEIIEEIEEQENLVVEAAPKSYINMFELLLDLSKLQVISDRYTAEIEKLVKKNNELERSKVIDQKVESGAESMTAFLSIMNTFSQDDLQKTLSDKIDDLMRVGVLPKRQVKPQDDKMLIQEEDDEIELQKATADQKSNKSSATSK